MIDVPILLVFVIILAAHFVGDFVLQTHWQASNKSKNNVALVEHVLVYTAVLGLVSGVLLGFNGLWFSFVWINGVLHFCTDYLTSRWSAAYFRPAMYGTFQMTKLIEADAPTPKDLESLRLNPDRHWHNFFVVIGFDQLIHQVTLATTLWLIVA